jgi:tetratricopeptide (TPR) repeat protein
VKDDDFFNLYEKALEFIDNEDYEKGIAQLKEIIEKDPTRYYAWYNMGLAYYRKKDWTNAIICYTEATKLKPDYYDAWYNMGLAYYENIDYKNASKSYDKALALNKNPDVLLNKGITEDHIGNKDVALQCYEESLKISPENPRTWLNKAFLLYDSKKVEDALASFKKVTEFDPTNDNAWYFMGLLYDELKQYKNAFKCFMESLKLDPLKKDSYEGIGKSLESLGLLREARYYFNYSRNLEKEKLDFTVSGSSPDITTDLWVSTDELGYDVYANTIAKLLLNLKMTPLAISIQAPWGAGKTSLMRIIQEKIDFNRNDQPIEKKDGILTYSKLTELKQELKSIINELKSSKEKNRNYNSIHEEQIVGLGVKTSENLRKNYVTIWFDPWEYENNEQLWAGLADCIIRGILNRMSSKRKQLFLLQLNLKIFNFKDLFRWLKSYVLRLVLNKLKPWLFVTSGGFIASGLALVVGTIPEVNQLVPNLSTAGAAGFGITSLQGLINFLRSQNETENMAVGFALNEYLKIPDYSSKLGKTHEAMEDIRRILKAIPDEYKPLVIFIDDLDRCSIDNIAKLFEGVNQFISTNLLNCIFIIGMDNQVIASSIDVIYEDVIKKFPEYLVQTQVGWRYLEKFIQLPILIPPTKEANFTKYVESVVSVKEHSKAIDSAYKGNHKSTPETDYYQNEAVSNQVDVDIEKLSKAAYIFSNNPREVKRFLNLVTYYVNLHSEIKRISPLISNLPTYEQIRRWIILIVKWPSLAQWLYWVQDPFSYSIPSDVLTSPAFRLRQLETLAAESKDQKEWETKVANEFEFNDPKNIPWITDNHVREFFRAEKKQRPGIRLSDGAGVGIY